MPKHHLNITHILLDGFLAVLLLLLTVSCVVVFRSFILRRRVTTNVRQAVAAGFIVDENGNIIGERPRPTPIGEKPTMWEVWVDEKHNENGVSQTKRFSDGTFNSWDEEKGSEGPWQGIQPVSVKVLSSTPSNPMRPSLNVSTPSITSNLSQQRSQPTYPSHPVSSIPPAPGKLEVSVLISMPNPNRRFSHGQASGNYALGSGGKDMEEESEVPDVLFGVTKVSVRP